MSNSCNRTSVLHRKYSTPRKEHRMTNTDTRNAYDMLYLASCAANGIVPDRTRLDGMDFESVYSLSVSHQLAALTFHAAADAFRSELPSDEIFQEWKQSKDKALRKQILFEAEYSALKKFFECEGIWFVPLKGTTIKNIYPMLGMREMSDIDILYDRRHRDRIISHLTEKGYTAHLTENFVHDEFYKKPVYNLELHKFLFSASLDVLHRYYINIEDKLLPVDGSNYERRFSENDLLIYTTAHEYKHYTSGGTGLRSLIDCYLLRKKLADSLDFEYINRELTSLGILDFSKEFFSLADKVLGNPADFSVSDLDEHEADRLNYILFSGAYGNFENLIRNKVSSFSDDSSSSASAKRRYIMSRLFPSMAIIKEFYPFFYRHKLLLPFLYIYRMIRSITDLPKYMREVRLLKKL